MKWTIVGSNFVPRLIGLDLFYCIVKFALLIVLMSGPDVSLGFTG